AVYGRTGDYARALAPYKQALALAQQVGDRQHQADLLWLIAIQHGELGQRDEAVAAGQMAIAIHKDMGTPEIAEFVESLRQYSQGNAGASLRNKEASPKSYYTGPTSAGAEPSSGPAQAGGTRLLRMAFSAAKSM